MARQPKRLNYDDLSHCILGAHFYASGGGGALKNGQHLLAEVVNHLGSKDNVEIKYLDLSDINDTDELPVLAAMGAPLKFLEKGYSRSPNTAFRQLQSLKSTAFTTLSPVETGAIAYGMSFLTAAVNRLPLINGDGGGRAFPCLQLSTFANNALSYPIAVSPCCLTSEASLKNDGGMMTINCQSSAAVDTITRRLISTPTFDDRASLAAFSMTGKQLKQPNAVVPDMLLKTLDLGTQIDECVALGQSCFDVINQLEGAQCIMQGQLTNIQSTTQGGFDWVTLEYTASGAPSFDKDRFYQDSHPHQAVAQKYYVISQNENMMLWSKSLSSPIAMAPDLICCLSSDASLMSNDEILEVWQTNPEDERLKNMAIYTLPAAPQIQQPWFHDNFAPILRQFGYYGSYHAPLLYNDPLTDHSHTENERVQDQRVHTDSEHTTHV